MSLAWATEFYYHITVSSGIFSHLPFTLAWKLLDESSVRRQTWNGAENSRSRFQGLRQFCGPLGELGKQVRTGTLPLAGTRPLAQMAHGLRVEYGQWGLPLPMEGRRKLAFAMVCRLSDAGFASLSSM